MSTPSLIVFLVLCVHLCSAGCKGYECLKAYVEKEDGHFEWKDTGYQFTGLTKHGFYTAHFLNVTSQKWYVTTSQCGGIY